MPEYKEPTFDADSYTCPHCGVFAHATRWDIALVNKKDRSTEFTEWTQSRCVLCGGETIWDRSELLWPVGRIGPSAQPDMPEHIARIYEEARTIGGLSPRAAAALLRLALQHLLTDLAADQKDVNKAIGALVKEGLPTSVQRAMDILRVVGNNAVHPGEIDLEGDLDTVNALFGLLNLVVEDRISKAKQIDAVYSALPPGALTAIEKRDQPG